MKFYAQMYSIREACEENFESALKAIADMGYDGVEFAGYYGLDVKSLKAIMDALKLETLSAHVSLELLQNDLDKQIEILTTLGAKYIVCPWTDMNSVTSARDYSLTLSEIGKKTAEAGLPLLYHNHAHEFEADQGSIPLEVFFDAIDEGTVLQEPDVYWVAHAGADVKAYLQAHETRIKVVHLKQIENMVSKKNVAAGQGMIDFSEVMTLVADADYVYEQEFSDDSVMEDMKKSLDYLRKL